MAIFEPMAQSTKKSCILTFGHLEVHRHINHQEDGECEGKFGESIQIPKTKVQFWTHEIHNWENYENKVCGLAESLPVKYGVCIGEMWIRPTMPLKVT